MSKTNREEGNLKNDPTGWILVALAAMTWGSDVLLRPRVLAAGVDSVTVVLYEHLALTLIFLPVIALRIGKFKFGIKEFLSVLFIAGAGSTLGTVLLTQAYSVGDPLTATLLQKLQPAFALAAAGLVLKEKPKPLFWPWFCLALAGAYLISFGFSWMASPLNQKGFYAAIYAVSAAGLWGVCTVVGRWTLNHIDPLSVAGLRFTFALPMLALWFWIGGHSASAGHIFTPVALLPMILIILLPDTLGMGLYYIGLKRTPASIATLAELAYPVTAMVLAIGSATRFSLGQWTGIGFLLVSLFCIRRQNLVQAPSIEP